MANKKETTKTSEVNEPFGGYQSGQPVTFEKVWMLFQETAEQFRETDRKFQATDRKIKELSDLFTSQWGKLVESLVEGAVVRLFRDAGIDVHYTSERVKGSWQGENFEFDILAHNQNDLVVIEVKTTLRPQDVKDFSRKMKKFKDYLPSYRDHRIRGSLACLKAVASAGLQAQKDGFYVIKATGDSATIINSETFVPRIF